MKCCNKNDNSILVASLLGIFREGNYIIEQLHFALKETYTLIIDKRFQQYKLYDMDTFYQQKPNRKRTWISQNNKHNKKTHYVMSIKKRTVRDVTVINYVGVHSNNCTVRNKHKCEIKKVKRSPTPAIEKPTKDNNNSNKI